MPDATSSTRVVRTVGSSEADPVRPGEVSCTRVDGEPTGSQRRRTSANIDGQSAQVSRSPANIYDHQRTQRTPMAYRGSWVRVPSAPLLVGDSTSFEACSLVTSRRRSLCAPSGTLSSQLGLSRVRHATSGAERIQRAAWLCRWRRTSRSDPCRAGAARRRRSVRTPRRL